MEVVHQYIQDDFDNDRRITFSDEEDYEADGEDERRRKSLANIASKLGFQVADPGANEAGGSKDLIVNSAGSDPVPGGSKDADVLGDGTILSPSKPGEMADAQSGDDDDREDDDDSQSGDGDDGDDDDDDVNVKDEEEEERKKEKNRKQKGKETAKPKKDLKGESKKNGKRKKVGDVNPRIPNKRLKVNE